MSQPSDVYADIPSRGKVRVYKDGEPVTEVLKDGNAAFTWLLRHQGQSVDYALRHGGYSVRSA
jgi:hypothetical protein